MNWASNETLITAMCELHLDWAQIHQNFMGAGERHFSFVL